MTAEENFDHQTLLMATAIAAHAARCLHAAGLLDDVAQRSIAGHFKNLSATATADGDPVRLAWLDLLQRSLPPPPT